MKTYRAKSRCLRASEEPVEGAVPLGQERLAARRRAALGRTNQAVMGRVKEPGRGLILQLASRL